MRFLLKNLKKVNSQTISYLDIRNQRIILILIERVYLKNYTNDSNPAMNDIFFIINMTFVTNHQFYCSFRFINSIDLNSIGWLSLWRAI